MKYENSKTAKSKEINLGIEGSESEVYRKIIGETLTL